MAASEGGVVDVLVHKFSHGVTTGQVHKPSLSPYSDYILFLRENGDIGLISVSSGEIINAFLDGHVKSFCWVTPNRNKDGLSRFLTQSSDGHFSLYVIRHKVSPSEGSTMPTATCECQCHVHTLHSVLEEAGIDVQDLIDCQPLAVEDDRLIMKVSQVIVTLTLHLDQPPELHQVVDAGLQAEAVCVKDGILIMVNSMGVAGIWCLETGFQVAEVSFADHIKNEISMVTISANLQYAAVISEQHLVAVHLDRYFKRNPSRLIKESQEVTPPSNAVRLPAQDEDNLPSLHKHRTLPPSERAWANKLKRLQVKASARPRRENAHWYRECGIRCKVSSQFHAQQEKKKVYSVLSAFSQAQAPILASDDHSEDAFFKLLTVGATENCQVMAMTTSGNMMTLWSQEEHDNNVMIVDMETGGSVTHRLSSDSLVVLSSSATFPSLVLTSGGLSMVVFNTEQELMVNRLMLYDSAGMADVLCRLNDWDRCSIPVHALEVGLRHRQLDTVAFFLKSRENVFVPFPMGSFAQPSTSSLASANMPEVTDLDLGQVESAVELLISTVASNIRDNQSKQFAEQLLQITVDYLHKVMYSITHQQTRVQELGQSNKDFEQEVSAALQKVMMYIERLRQYMTGSYQRSRRTESVGVDRTHVDTVDGGPIVPDHVTGGQGKLLKHWHNMTPQDAIIDGILAGEIPLLQVFLQQSGYGSHASLTTVVDFGLRKALEFLQQKQLLLASQMFANLGFDVWSKVTQVCLYTPDRPLRDYLTTELVEAGRMTPEDISMVRFVHKLESLYSCPSFDLAKLLRSEGNSSDWEKQLDVSALLGESAALSVLTHCGDLIPCDVTNSETSSYTHVLLEWTRRWDEATRQLVCLDQVLTRRDACLSEGLAAAVVWRHLVSREDMPRLQSWIEAAFPDPHQWVGQAAWPSSLRLDTSLLAELDQCTTRGRDKLLDMLTRRGVLSGAEVSNFPLLVTRLARSCAVIGQPHLLEMRSEVHASLLIDFHTNMVAFCLERRLPSLLYFYLDFWGLCLGSSDFGEVGLCQGDIQPWAAMLLYMRAVSHYRNDPGRVFEASLASSAYIQDSTEGSVSVISMFEDGLVGRALATLVYDPVQLKQLVTGTEDQPAAIMKWEPALRLLPRVHAALCQPKSDGVAQQDITVYQLLQGNVPFDVTHLFGWQKTNALAAGDTEMPHFAQPELVAQYGHKEALKYTYYLRQGRPCFAFCAYIISQLQAGAKTLVPVRLRAVFRYTHLLAIRHFHQPPIAAACVAFLEMLGFDTTVLRINVQVATMIMTHEGSEVTGTVEQRRQMETQIQRNITQLLIGCVKRKRKIAADILSMLEDAIHHHLDKFSIKSTSMDAALLWQLAVMFSRAHGLPLSTAFLSDCALADDWLMFLTFSQLHQYDKQLVHGELRHFSSRSLHEHLYYVVENVDNMVATPTGTAKKQSQIKSRDIRAQLYSRIGLTRVMDTGESSVGESSPEEDLVLTEVIDQPDPDTGETELILPSESATMDVFSLLLACEETVSPWQCLVAFSVRHSNPVLSVLAACHQNYNFVSCICSWLVASSTGPAQQDLIDRYSVCELREWSKEDLVVIIITMAKHFSVTTVLTAFRIFDPTSLMASFLKFCVAFNHYDDEETCKQHLEAFKCEHSNALRCSRTGGNQSSNPLDLTWTEGTVAAILCLYLDMMSSDFELGRLLKLFAQTNVLRLFTCQVPDFNKLHQLHQISQPSGILLNYSNLTSQSESIYEQECKKALNELENNKLFSEARVFAEVAKVSKGQITIRQLESELRELSKSTVWQQTSARCSFWHRCHDLMKRYRVPATSAADFFQEKISQCTSHTERVLVCQVAYDWLGQDDQPANHSRKENLFIQIWQSKIQAHLHQQKGVDVVDGVKQWLLLEDKPTFIPVDRAKLLHYGHIPSVADTPNVKLNNEEKEALEVLIGQLLDGGSVKEACQVAALLGHYSKDLSVVRSCLQLSLAHLTPDQLDMSVRMVMMQPKLRMSRRLSNVSTSSLTFTTQMVIQEEPDSATDNVLTALEMLLPNVTRGKHCCQRIVTTYQIAKVLDKPFEWVVSQDEFVILQQLLKRDIMQHMSLAKSYLGTSSLTSAQVAGFLSDTMLEMLKSAAGVTTPDGTAATRGPVLETVQDSGVIGAKVSMVNNLIELCEDKALLGHRLHDNLKCLMSSSNDMSPKMLTVCVKLLVFSHHCFTLACSMEGIAAILHSARTLTLTLEQGDHYHLMIQLLTGVGRFGEMTYIFDILKQQHQFELLFRKGIDKEESLRLAIMDYVQRCHPSDSDTYKMVSLYFTMYREIAAMLEENAHKQLQGLRGKHLENSSHTQTTLQSILHYYSDAAESYAKENCLRHAQRCVKNARLVALQIDLLNSGQKVLNLTKNEVSTFITTHQKFWEAYIVAEGYSHHGSWADAILRRVLLQGDARYLTDLRAHVPLTPALIADVAERYRAEPHKPKSAINQMKKLLSYCKDIQMTYRLANDLGLTELCRELLKGENGAYLRDLMTQPH